MQIPSILFGQGPVVGRSVRTALKKWGARPPTGLDLGELMSTDAAPTALILLDQTDRKRVSDDFHCYALAHAVMDFIDDTKVVDQWFQWWLKSAWSTAGLLGSAGAFYFTQANFMTDGSRDHCREDFLRAVAAHLDEWTQVGPRFKLLATTSMAASLGIALHYESLRLAGFPATAIDDQGLREALERFQNA